MPFAWIDGFDDYKDTYTNGIGLSSSWIVYAGGGGPDLVSGRFGNRGVAMNNYLYINWGGMRRVFPKITTDVCVGFAFRLNSIGLYRPGIGFIFAAIEDDVNNYQLELRVNDSGEVKVVTQGNVDQNTGNVLLTAHRHILNNTWHFIELVAHCDTGAGSIHLWIDGEDQGAVQGINTNPSGRGGFNRLNFRSPDASTGYNAPEHRFDDNYVKYDDSTPVGECRALLMQITGDDAVQWTRLAGATNASQVQEQQVDGDTTYNSSNVIGQKDMFPLEALTGNPTKILAFQLSLAGKKDDAATRTVAPHISVAGVDVKLADQYQTTDYTFGRVIMETNPAANRAWAKADFNVAGNIKVGYELTQ